MFCIRFDDLFILIFFFNEFFILNLSFLNTLSTRSNLRLPSLTFWLCSVIWNIGPWSTGKVHSMNLWQWVCSFGNLFWFQLAWRGVGTVSQPIMPAWFHMRHINIPFLVLNPSGSQVDFYWILGFVVFVTVVVCSDIFTGFGIT